jgi:uncharacterized membrane protein HdeD (DUF308 family)
MLESFGKNWWVLVVQGVLAILFGIGALLLPGLTLVTLVAIFAASTILDGAITLVAAFTAAGPDMPRWWFIVRGLIGIAAGVAAFAWPGLTALLLIFVVAARFLLNGIVEIAAAIALRKEVQSEWLLVVSGALSIIAGAWFFAAPGDGALTLAWLIGLFAVMTCATLISAGLRLRGIHSRIQETGRTSPA